MRIHVALTGFYDWQPVPAGITPTGNDFKQLRVKQMHSGEVLMRVEKEANTHTDVSIPESEIEDCMAHFERIGSPKTRAQTVAWYLQEKVMPHHAHPNHFGEISVEAEPEVQSFLNQYFGVSK